MINNTKRTFNIQKYVDSVNQQYSAFLGCKKRVCQYFNKEEPIMVSVIVNCYNHSKYIKQCLESILNQYVDFNVEVLVHDDCSQDESQDIIESISKSHPNHVLPIFQKENMYSKHKSITYTFQVPRAKGKYIAFCEGDDYWSFEYKLINQIHFLESHPNYSCCGHNSIVNVNGHESLFCKKINEDDLSTIEALSWDESLRIHFSSLVVKSNVLRMNRPSYYHVISHVGDRSIVIFASEHGLIKYFPFVGSFYRKFSSTDSWSSNNEKDLTGQLYILKNLCSFYSALSEYFQNDETIKNHCVTLYNKSLYDYCFLSCDFKAITTNNNLKTVKKTKSVFHRMCFPLCRIFPCFHKLYIKRVFKL